MKRTILFFLLAGFLFVNSIPSFCHETTEGEDYKDAKLVLTNLADLVEAFVENMNQAEKPEDVAKLLNAFAENMKGLVPKINTIREKYPELDNEDTHPEELKSLMERIDKDFQEMMKSYAKVNDNLSDPAVKEADEKFKEVMSALG